MKTAQGCKLFGAHQALSGIRGSVVLLHSVVGCNFGTMSFHAACDMSEIRQTCTVISDSEVVFGGENSLKKALAYAEELFVPEVIFVVTGCVSDMIQDDVNAVAGEYRGKARVIPVEAAGYRGRVAKGYEEALAAAGALLKEKTLAEEELSARYGQKKIINLLGTGADDFRLRQDMGAFRSLLGDRVCLNAAVSCCSIREFEAASCAQLNLLLDRGRALAENMEKQFAVPWQNISYPYGLTGADELWNILGEHFGIDFSQERRAFSERTAQGLKCMYSYLQALYGMPAAVIGSSARCRGMMRFLEQELGIETVVHAIREDVEDIEDFYDRVRASEAAIIFGSSFEKELADEMKIPLVRYDYPVFDRVCVSNRPYIGAEGTLCLVEDILNEIMGTRNRKGALYQ